MVVKQWLQLKYGLCKLSIPLKSNPSMRHKQLIRESALSNEQVTMQKHEQLHCT